MDNIYEKSLIPKEGIIYKENPETGIINIDIKLERVNNGGVFEWEDMIVCNRIIGDCFIKKDVKSIINIGSGVGTFEFYNAPKHADVTFTACEMDVKSTEWARNHRAMPNVDYCISDMASLQPAKYDMAISIDVLEHVKDYPRFLRDFSKLSDYAIISTPNRDRSVSEIKRPSYVHHVREFNSGELYYVLKTFYEEVRIYSLRDRDGDEGIVEIGLYSVYDKLIAECKNTY